MLQGKQLSILVIAFWLGILPPALSAQDAPYEGKMLRIAEVLGSLHYLRNLCGETSNEWRERMDAIIAAEKPDEAERLRLVSSFNHGYRAFSDNYVRCTPSALAAIDRYMKEGESLSNELISRYGN
ncbi:TIGR02301 family protein [Brucella pituitosa]|uniref:TIGR02301 family protein n=2 Tax=Brucella pituitosa TaxID=571256 RepID=A0A643F8R2_9HYPH|nr:TIGR02301 family protein [Brucella pituitosa]MCK4204645.1 TIGR02301 family protein [Brucella pituitosa]PJO47998.1 TIGR02301 family protein [Brucella pituitosa]PRA87309.1 TIGR02301 family protein [Ochrobactrum sp. MYb29]